jgi:hypothetical protein
MTEAEKNLVILYKQVFCTEAGKKVLENLRSVFNFDLSVIPKDNQGRTDIYEVFRNEGKRSVVLHILKKTEKDLNEIKSEPESEEKYI